VIARDELERRGWRLVREQAADHPLGTELVAERSVEPTHQTIRASSLDVLLELIDDFDERLRAVETSQKGTSHE